ncbi:MAG: sporulation protein YtfJ [Oscillospiraceae bacterium]|nr:sporulation protein YtfJ [Oscillospiraceae bacterium]MBQ7089803.1 sporulation protein YtfJ [Clostridia bacterium]
MEQKNNQLSGLLQFVAAKTMELSKENTVLGEPIEKDGVTVIPVSKLSVGFAGGGADLQDVNRKKRQQPAGGGAKVTLTPMCFLVISGGEVEIIELSVPEKQTAVGSIVDAVIDQVKGMKKDKKE